MDEAVSIFSRAPQPQKLNPYLLRATMFLSDEWIPFREIKLQFDDWDALDYLALIGIAEERCHSPYRLNGDGNPIYLGSWFEFRVNPTAKGLIPGAGLFVLPRQIGLFT